MFRLRLTVCIWLLPTQPELPLAHRLFFILVYQCLDRVRKMRCVISIFFLNKYVKHNERTFISIALLNVTYSLSIVISFVNVVR